MVRFLVGTIVDIGLDRRPVEDMAALLAALDNQATSPPAPPQGLYFVAAEYPTECYAEVHAMIRRPPAALAVAALLACGGAREAPAFIETLEAQRPTRPAVTDALAASRRTAIVEAAETVSPAVVSITVTSTRQASPQTPFDFFFVPPSPREQQSFGTGFIIRSDGVILTNQHVVGGADRIIVTLPDGSDVPATLLGEDPLTDIAVIRVNRARLRTVKTGRSTDLMIGEWVVALGNPFALPAGQRGANGHRGRDQRRQPQHPAGTGPVGAVPRHDPDRRVDQPRQLRRTAGQRAGRGRRA